MKYITHGVCSRQINFEVENNILTKVEFIGGCTGNTQGVSRLCIGRTVDDVISLLKGIECRGNTSCPDQLATALIQYKENNK